MFCSWCLHMGNMEFVDDRWTCRFCKEDLHCPYWNNVLAQVWVGWPRKDTQGVTTECWRNVCTKMVFGHFWELDEWELMWKSESSSADTNKPPLSTGGMETNELPLKKHWVWLDMILGKEVAFMEISISEMDRIGEEMESD